MDNKAQYFTVADDATTAGGVTETVVNYGTGTYELKIPNLGVDVNVSPTTEATLSGGGAVDLTNISLGQAPGLLDYVSFNEWQVQADTGFAMIGYQTPVGSMPSSGTATYTGSSNVSGEINSPVFAGVAVPVTGSGSMTANFATGGVNGSFSNLVAAGGDVTSWNAASFTGSISGDRFSGSTSANAYGSVQNATGSITGGFYGPNASEVGAVWTLYDGQSEATGVFGAPVSTSSSGMEVSRATAAAPSFGASPPATPAAGYQKASAVELKIPNLGIDVSLTQTGTPVQALAGKSAELLNRGALSYSEVGRWAVDYPEPPGVRSLRPLTLSVRPRPTQQDRSANLGDLRWPIGSSRR